MDATENARLFLEVVLQDARRYSTPLMGFSTTVFSVPVLPGHRNANASGSCVKFSCSKTLHMLRASTTRLS
jgi:hypothetical protein